MIHVRHHNALTGAGYPPRVLATVSFETWAPSEGGQVNTTSTAVISVDVWVNHPQDVRYKPDERGGDQAIAIVKAVAAKERIEWLSLVSVRINNQAESTIVNQPKETQREPGTGMRLIKEPGEQ